MIKALVPRNELVNCMQDFAIIAELPAHLPASDMKHVRRCLLCFTTSMKQPLSCLLSTYTVAACCRTVVKHCICLDMLPTSALCVPLSLQGSSTSYSGMMYKNSKQGGIQYLWTCIKGVWRFLRLHLCACAAGVFAIRPHTADARMTGALLSRQKLLNMVYGSV